MDRCSSGGAASPLFLRSRYLPGPLACLGVFAFPPLVVASIAMFVYAERADELKPLGLPLFLAEFATALWLLFKGLLPRVAAEARA